MQMARRVLDTSLLVTLALIVSANVAAQTAPQFDVASIKPSQTPPGRGPLAALREDINTTPGNLTMRNVTLATSIRWAYKLNAFQMSGPDSISADRFDIVAKAAT